MIEECSASRFEEVYIFPASFAQQRLWFLDQFVPDTSLYNVPTVFRLTGILHQVALKQSFNQIVQRHETLRTSFTTQAGQLLQAIAPDLKVILPWVDLRDLPVAMREPEALRQVRQAIEQPFDLSNGPLLRLLLLQLDHIEHILLINLHHIVFDEWSSGVLIRELGAFYTAALQNKPAMLPEPPIQYADFAHWQREYLQGETLETQLNYWRQQLQNAPVLNLPSRSALAIPSYKGAVQLLELPQRLLDELEDLSQQQDVTLFMTLLAAFQILLARYSGQEDIAVGSPIANRNRSELEDLIGFFVNSLVFRTDLSGNPTVRELLGRVREVALGAYAHQDLPFEKLVEELHPERNLSRNPLFQVVFALQNAPMSQLELPQLTLSALKFETKTTRFDLELYLWKCSDNFRQLWGNGWQQTEGLRGVVVYNTDLFEAELIQRLCHHFQTLLEGMVAHPDARLAELPILTATEQQWLSDWNKTQTDYPADRCIHQLFEDQVRRSPDAIAMRFTGRSFTYQALNQGSNQLAHYLQQVGLKPRALVGVCLEQSSEAIAAMLGILKAGAAYVPLDPTYPPERLRMMIADAQVSIVLTDRPFAERLSECGATVICLGQEWETIAQASEDNPTGEATPDQLAYVIYTSGSTGQPKGVAVTHRAVNRLVCQTNYVQLNSTDTVAQVSNLAFDAATFEIWGALLNGAQLVEIDRATTLTPSEFAAQIRQQQISVLFLTTALLNQIVRDVPDAFRSLKYLLFGGEAVDPRWVRALLQQGKPDHLLHVYGPTENTTFTTWYEIQNVAEDAVTIPIGRAVANTQVYLLDQHLNPVPIGISGEIYVGGDGLAQGYLNRMELTAERFVSNPFQFATKLQNAAKPAPDSVYYPYSATSSLLYKTGDLARYRSDGNLEFLGRIDDQVKLRGFRIELGEIEAVLSQHPAVQEAVVVVREVEGNKRLIAYTASSQPLLPSDLRTFLKAKLPDYMLPSAFVNLKALPLTPNGKVDRRALPVLIQTESAPIDIAPRTAVETALAEIWMALLGVKHVGVQDNFFELGGHSLLATQLVSKIRVAFQIEVPLRYLFEAPTVAGLAQYIETTLIAQKEANLNTAVNSNQINLRQREEVEL